ncbi:HlyD family efflux transporter periplasmic adaptor subunit [Pectobacterium carotovorum]|uniref:HlyD family efflux transporter periplasmic adaptor subunit n=1 Tax=Pectobacterium carotovorum TaxID=554 RepID=UPI000583ACAC|nr:HlyD family efflux transporter periplasmic adaptor subunit [Pectobacterium carotovorum]KHS85444.1 peptidase M50 [Pectobacterium carotovorum subsp. carotovorum]MBB1526981.1 HlyD family efflux transporter periplasmic adaptor subunit [Pectobacterium carotovorum subsp. carotovorum]MCA6965499.1 HlyD family efflux transporter periplasmic adaptor subunit [Pectobacterium carotovorum]MCH4987922.1 HlyD family efflux transporter periplasmic adaptor subunit [Pectobacterium carotovorum]MCQ8234537.1 HlyD
MNPHLPPLRADLQLVESAPGINGAPQWVLSDPITGRYFTLTPSAIRLLRHWPLRQPQQILAAANNEPGLPLRVKELEQLLQFLRQHDLVAASDPEQRRRYLGKAQAMRTSLWKSVLHQYLFFRIPLWRPDPVLNRCWPWLQRYGAPFLIWVFPLILLLGLFLVSRDWVRYTHSFPHLFSLSGMAVFGVSLVFAKFIHELGHAFMAKRAGCRVQSMGVAFIVLFPLFYTDTTDAWKLKDRQARLLIGAGGILAELMLAVIALLAWALLPDGPARTAAFMLSSATWLTTLVVNLNPLMRFDGYFLLSDFWRVENLQERAYALCRWRLRESLFGHGHPAPENLSPSLQRKLLVWGYASWIWRFFLFFGIALVVYHFFIKVIGIGLMLVEIVWFIALPIAKEAYAWWSMRKSIHPIAFLRSALLCSTLLFILLYPWGGSIHIPAVLESEKVSTLYSPVPAQVNRLHVTDGQRVDAGDILLELTSVDLDYRLDIERQRIAQLQQQRQRGAARQETASEIQVMDWQLAEALARYRGLAAQRQRLTIRAPQAGVVRDLARDMTAGRWLTADTPLLRVVEPTQGRVIGYIPEESLMRTQEGMQGIFLADDPAFPRLDVMLHDIAPTGSAYLQQEMLASDRHGPIAVRRDRDHNPQPVQAQYRVRFMVQEEQFLPLQQPLRGNVILEGEKESILGTVWRRVAALGIRESGF